MAFVMHGIVLLRDSHNPFRNPQLLGGYNLRGGLVRYASSALKNRIPPEIIYTLSYIQIFVNNLWKTKNKRLKRQN